LQALTVAKDLSTANVQQTHPSQKKRRLVNRLLVELANDPDKEESLKRQFGNVRLSLWEKTRIELMRQRLGLPSSTEAIRVVVEAFETKTPVIPEASLDTVFSDDSNIQIAGRPGAGKSTFVKTILPQIKQPVFIVDVAGEYQGIKKIAIGDLYALRWSTAPTSTQIRFVPAASLEIAKVELKTVFELLNQAKTRNYHPGQVPSGALKSWVIVCEEAHRVHRETQFRNFLAEGRKFVSKILVIASDPNLYGEVCRVLRPPEKAQVS